MKAFKVYNASTEGWLVWPERTFYAHAVYATAFTTHEDAEEAANVTEAHWAGHRIQVVEVDVNSWADDEPSEEEQRAADEWDSVIAEREAAHWRQVEAKENERTEREDSYAY